MYRIGLDLGSTTIKAVVLCGDGKTLFHKYVRHNAKVYEVLFNVLDEIVDVVGEESVASLAVTGSVGMGIAEKCRIPFVQEVVAATKAIAHKGLSVNTMIDIGGEDAKVVFFNKDGVTEDLRMNGNCSGGTGAFIDQMAIILGEDIDKLSLLAEKSTKTYQIASRCGVFCKTDIQNLIAKGVEKEDIAASIFRAVVVQTVVTLAHGCEIKPPILLCGGPLTYIASLRKSYREYLNLSEDDFILPEDGSLLPALGTAIGHSPAYRKLNDIVEGIKTRLNVAETKKNTLAPLFVSDEDHQKWSLRVLKNRTAKGVLTEGYKEAFLGIDSGSTTTKVVVIDCEGKVLFQHYSPNKGQPVAAVRNALKTLDDKCLENGTMLNIVSACSTGYGEDLIKAAFGLDFGIIETVAHFIAAKKIDPQVSFILDIGGQDIKAMYVSEGVINRIEINEACSSGCGSFLETFARSTGLTVYEFAAAACCAQYPCDLGTRCTVFMNSKVKQVLREGYSAEDIAAGLAYSVIKNCLYKVLKVNDVSSLGKHIVVQGGTMRNDAVVKALEMMTGTHVSRSDMPELMGAYGCALYAFEHRPADVDIAGCRLPKHLVDNSTFSSRSINCKGCENSCLVTAYRFRGERNFYSGNRCERIFCNSGERTDKGISIYEYKYHRIFQPLALNGQASLKIGIPRCLNIYEDFPFWQRLFVECGFNVILSDDSDYSNYERNAGMVMSDNLCFPAKIVHSHISNLVEKKVDRIFFPFVIHSRQNGGENSYNCPIVTGYTEVVRNVQKTGIPLDSFTFSMKESRLFRKQCCRYLESLGVDEQKGKKAFDMAMMEIQGYESQMADKANEILASSHKEGRMTIMLVGRPYHSDPLIQHNVADMIASLGVNVISEDVVRLREGKILSKVNFVSQWTYTNRILQAAKWCAAQGNDVQFVQMTSFGCGPDAFLTDAVKDILMESGKSLTLLKLDDINNVGSMKLRVRSLVDTMLLSHSSVLLHEKHLSPPVYEEKHRNRKILIPYFTPFISPLLPALMKPLGYDVEGLPVSDEKSAEYGLKYANNEVCYPATLVVGDFVKAFKEGRYNPSECAVAMTQTGGQCRASNYLPMIKKALIDAGYTDTPVISVAFGSGLENKQPGFKVNWLKMIPSALYSLLFSDSIAKMYYACVAREKEAGTASRLMDRYLADGAVLLEKGQWKALLELVRTAAEKFNDATVTKVTHKVGVVGEIYLKFNPFAHKHVVDWLIAKGVEIVPPILTDFFTQFFVNRKVKKASLSEDNRIPDWIYNYLYKLYKKHVSYFNKAGARFRYWSDFNDIFHEAKEAERIINLNAQFGEGWLLPAEVATYYKSGVKNVISLQPFGCIANHIIVRGVEKRMKELFSQLNLLSLDFDSGVSDVNVMNRMLLFIDNLG